GHGRQTYVHVPDLHIAGFGRSVHQIATELWPRYLCLAMEHDVESAVGKALGAEGGVGATRDDQFPPTTKFSRQLPRPVVLDIPAADRHHVGVGIEADGVAVFILQLHLDVAWGHARHRYEPERRLSGADVEQLFDALETPQRVREAGVHEEDLHRVLLLTRPLPITQSWRRVEWHA